MKRINPQYLLGFFVLIAVLMIVQSGNLETKTLEVNQNTVALEEEGKLLQGLKERWKNPEKSRKVIDAVLSETNTKPLVKQQEVKAGVYMIKLEKVDRAGLDRILNRLLNESVTIKGLKVKRTSENDASVEMECQL